MKTLNQIQQINILLKHCNRNGLTITFFNVLDNCVFANLKWDVDGEIAYKTVFCVIPECEYKFNLIP